MKALIGVGIFEKQDMIAWHLSGISDNYDREVEVCFYFEACKDDSEAEFDRLAPEILRGFKYSKASSKEHILEDGVHRFFIDMMMSGGHDVLLIPQDDNRMQGNVLPDLEKLWDIYSTNLGWISGRDGYDFGYANMFSSPFSDSNMPKTAIPVGEYREVKIMNTGPVVYFRHVVEKVGLPDPELPWYFPDDYSLRCHHAGLKNILLSMDCLHMKFGKVGFNHQLYSAENVAKSLKRLNDKWRPVYGRNVI